MESLDQQQSTLDFSITPRSTDSLVPLSAHQARFFATRTSHEVQYRMPASTIWILGPLNISYLRNSLDEIVRRHEALRTRFVTVSGILRQIIDSSCDSHLELIDLTHMSGVEALQEAIAIEKAVLNRTIDVSVGPFLEAKLLKLSAHEHALILVVDHLIADGLSCGILNRELWTLYAQAERETQFLLPELPVQLPDYAIWQERMHPFWKSQHEGYWKGRFSGVTDTLAPFGDVEEIDRSRGATFHSDLGLELSKKLKNLALSERVPLSLVMLVVYVIVTSHWWGVDDLAVGFISHGRHRSELKGMIGWTADAMYLRLRVEPRSSFLDLLRQAHAERVAAEVHYDYAPYFIPEFKTSAWFNWQRASSYWLTNELADKANSGRKEARNRLHMKLFPTSFSWGTVFVPLFFYDATIGITIVVHYRPDRIATAIVEKFCRNIHIVTEEFVNSPSKCIALIPVDMS